MPASTFLDALAPFTLTAIRIARMPLDQWGDDARDEKQVSYRSLLPFARTLRFLSLRNINGSLPATFSALNKFCSLETLDLRGSPLSVNQLQAFQDFEPDLELRLLLDSKFDKDLKDGGKAFRQYCVDVGIELRQMAPLRSKFLDFTIWEDPFEL